MVTRRIPVREGSQGWTFYEDSRGTFWLADLHGPALAVFDRATNTLTAYAIDEPEAPGPMLVRFTAMVEDRSGTLWLATQGSGVFKFDGRRQELVRYRHDPGDPTSIAQNNVEKVFVDREGSLWAGLGSMGVTRSSTVPLPFARVPRDPSNPANVDSVAFTLSAAATTVKAKLVQGGATYTSCTVSGGVNVTCDFAPDVSVVSADGLSVVAAQ